MDLYRSRGLRRRSDTGYTGYTEHVTTEKTGSSKSHRSGGQRSRDPFYIESQLATQRSTGMLRKNTSQSSIVPLEDIRQIRKTTDIYLESESGSLGRTRAAELGIEERPVEDRV